jgi:hypothetical protein
LSSSVMASSSIASESSWALRPMVERGFLIVGQPAGHGADLGHAFGLTGPALGEAHGAELPARELPRGEGAEQEAKTEADGEPVHGG